MTQKYRQRKIYAVSQAALHSTAIQVIRNGKVHKQLGDFGTYFGPNLALIAEDPDMGALDLRVLLLFLATMDRQNECHFLQSDMAVQLGVSRATVNHAMRTLVEKGFIFQSGRHYALNSRIGSKSTLAEILRHQDIEIPILKKAIRRDEHEALVRKLEGVKA